MVDCWCDVFVSGDLMIGCLLCTLALLLLFGVYLVLSVCLGGWVSLPSVCLL